MERSSDSHDHHNSMDGDEGRADTASATLSITDTYCSLPTPPPHSETMPHLPPTATALSETGRGRESTPLRDGSQIVEAEEPASVTSAADVDSLTAEVCLSRYESYPPATATADVVAVVVPQIPRHPSRHPPSPPPPPFSTVQLYTPDAAAHVTPRPLSAAPHSLPVSSPASPLHRDVRGRSVGAGRTPTSPAPSKAAAAAAVHRRPDDGSMLSCALPQLGTNHARSYPPPTYTAEAEEAPVSVRNVAATRRSRGVVRPLLVELLELESSGFITAAPHAASAPAAAAATRAAVVPRGSDGHSSPAAPPTPSVVVMSAATSPLGADGGGPSPPPPRPPSPPLSVPPSLPQRRPAHSHPSSLIPRWVYTMGDQLSSRLTEAAATPALQSVTTPPHDASPHYPAAPAAAESTGGEVAALPVQLTDSEAQAARRRQHLPHNPNALHLPWLLAVRQGSSSSRTSAGESTTAATSGGAAGGGGGSVPLSARPTATTTATTTTTTTTAMTTAATSPSSTVSSPTPMSVGLQRQQWRWRESADSPSRSTRLHAETDVAETRTPGGDTAAPDVGGADTLIDDVTGSFRRRPVMSAFASTDAVAAASAASVRSAHTQPHTLPAAYRNASGGDGSDGGAGRGGLLAAFPLLSSALSSDFHALMAQLGAGGSVHDAAAAVLPTTVATTTTATTAVVVESEYSYRGTTGEGSRGIFTPPPLPAISSAGSLSSDSVLPLPYFLPPSHLTDSPAREVARDSANNDHDDHGDDEGDEEGGVGEDRAGLWRMERAVQSTADAAVVDEEERSLASLYAAATMSASPSASSLRRPAE